MEVELQVIAPKKNFVEISNIMYKGTDVSGGDATEKDVVQGKYFYSQSEMKRTGSLVTQDITLNPSENGGAVTPPPGVYFRTVTVAPAPLEELNITPSYIPRVNTPPEGKYGFKKVTVAAIPPTYHDTQDADALPSDILTGKTAYGSSGKITGTLQDSFEIMKAVMEGTITGSFTIPKGVTKLKRMALFWQLGMTRLEIPKEVTYIGNDSFLHCRNLTEVYYNAKKADNNGQDNGIFGLAGHDSGGITLTIGPDVEELTEQIFCAYGYKPNNGKFLAVKFTSTSRLSVIGNYVFANMNYIKELHIPASIALIGNGLGYGCDALKVISIAAMNPPRAANTWSFDNSPIVTNAECFLYVPDSAVESYKSVAPYSGFTAKIKPLSQMPTFD